MELQRLSLQGLLGSSRGLAPSEVSATRSRNQKWDRRVCSRPLELPPSRMSVPLPAMLVAMVMAPGRPACAGLSATWLRLAKAGAEAGADACNSICSHHICLSQQGWDDICMQAERARKGVTYTLPALCKP